MRFRSQLNRYESKSNKNWNKVFKNCEPRLEIQRNLERKVGQGQLELWTSSWIGRGKCKSRQRFRIRGRLWREKRERNPDREEIKEGLRGLDRRRAVQRFSRRSSATMPRPPFSFPIPIRLQPVIQFCIVREWLLHELEDSIIGIEVGWRLGLLVIRRGLWISSLQPIQLVKKVTAFLTIDGKKKKKKKLSFFSIFLGMSLILISSIFIFNIINIF